MKCCRAGAILSLLVLLVLAPSTIVHSPGIHRVYEDARDNSLPGERALTIDDLDFTRFDGVGLPAAGIPRHCC
ncbi:MAG: hypothetical protein KDI33_18275 [Halioglobus sp.]|nr:hypothetical protein [Halioglobus sp.]